MASAMPEEVEVIIDLLGCKRKDIIQLLQDREWVEDILQAVVDRILSRREMKTLASGFDFDSVFQFVPRNHCLLH